MEYLGNNNLCCDPFSQLILIVLQGIKKATYAIHSHTQSYTHTYLDV